VVVFDTFTLVIWNAARRVGHRVATDLATDLHNSRGFEMKIVNGNSLQVGFDG
jgi:hypothetical protein